MQSNSLRFTELNILNIEYHTHIQQKISQMMLSFGVPKEQIRQVRTLKQSTEFLSKIDYDVIVLGNSPDILTIEFAQKLRCNDYQHNAQTALLVTSTADPKQIKTIENATYLENPSNPKDLYLRFLLLLSRPRQFLLTRKHSSLSAISAFS